MKEKIDTIKSLRLEIDILKEFLAKLCHFTGQERVLDEYNIDRWKPGINDMRKFKDK